MPPLKCDDAGDKTCKVINSTLAARLGGYRKQPARMVARSLACGVAALSFFATNLSVGEEDPPPLVAALSHSFL